MTEETKSTLDDGRTGAEVPPVAPSKATPGRLEATLRRLFGGRTILYATGALIALLLLLAGRTYLWRGLVSFTRGRSFTGTCSGIPATRTLILGSMLSFMAVLFIGLPPTPSRNGRLTGRARSMPGQ